MQKRKILETSKASGKNTNYPVKPKLTYRIKSHSAFEKEVLKVPNHVQRKTYRILSQVKENPSLYPPNTSYLRGYKDIFRTRIGKYRLVYQVKHIDKTIFVLGIDTRGEVYKIIRRLLS